MLAHAFQNGQSWEVVDPTIIKTIVDKLLDPPEEVTLNSAVMGMVPIYAYGTVECILKKSLHVGFC